MANDSGSLQTVVLLSEKLREQAPRIRARAMAQANAEIASLAEALERSVVAAKAENHRVTDIARALTTPGKTPNRNRVYEILKKYENHIDSRTEGFPFEWVARQVETAQGEATVYDIHTIVQDFGPDSVTGEYTWRYDVATGRPEAVFSLDYEPWPLTKHYQSLIQQWVDINPYPGRE